MSSFKTILCPTDFSECSLEALTVALEVAEKLDASVTLAHVCPYPVYLAPGFAEPSMVNDAGLIEERAARELKQWAAEHTKDAKVPVTTHLEQGEVYSKIIDAAEETKADMIVMGTHGRTGFTRFLMGSVADRIVRTAECPVLTVPPSEDGNAAE